MKDRVIMERLSKRGDPDTFDQEFWGKVGHEGRFAAAWDMIKEVKLMRGQDATQPRLQRSVESFERKKR